MSVAHKLAVMNQYAVADGHADVAIAVSGLAHAALPGEKKHDTASDNKLQGSGVRLRVPPVAGLLQIRAVQSRDALSKALRDHIGIELSARLQSESENEYCIRWMSPDGWLLSCPLDEVFSIEQAIRSNVDSHLALLNVSGGYSVLELGGSKARDVLMKSTPYDVHPDHFPAGKVVNSTFAKTQATLRCIDGERYELIVRRSYTDYVWLWLQRAAAEYGMTAVAID